MKYRLYIDVTAGLLILLFVYTALSKLHDHSFFLAQLKIYPLINDLAGIISWTIPAVELLIALMLLVPAYKTKGLAAALVLLTAFTLYLAATLLYAPDLPCSCGGVIQAMTWEQHVTFNCFFIVINAAAIVLNKYHSNKNMSVNELPSN